MSTMAGLKNVAFAPYLSRWFEVLTLSPSVKFILIHRNLHFCLACGAPVLRERNSCSNLYVPIAFDSADAPHLNINTFRDLSACNSCSWSEMPLSATCFSHGCRC